MMEAWVKLRIMKLTVCTQCFVLLRDITSIWSLMNLQLVGHTAAQQHYRYWASCRPRTGMPLLLPAMGRS